MINKDDWMCDLTAELEKAFSDRLLFVGLQGSYHRREAGPDSDIDAVVILDRVEVEDLETYRSLLKTMPEADKACGFISGAEELRHWPKLDLFQFVNDTEAWKGDLSALVPPIDNDDIRLGVKAGAANLYHLVCHTRVHADAEAGLEALRGAYKGAFFVLQAAHYLRVGEYVPTRKALRERLDGREGGILAIGADWAGGEDGQKRDPDALFRLLLEWTRDIITSF